MHIKNHISHIFKVIVIFFLIVGAFFSTNAQAAEIRKPDKPTVLEMLKAHYKVPQERHAFIQSMRESDTILFGIFAVDAPGRNDAGPIGHYFVAKQNGPELTIIPEYAPGFVEELETLNSTDPINQ
ncbi:MAG TPA: hypothetical protein VFD54_18215, partial [Anaerolineales bacterium]|nr:hypothetical protein [Anaerolineales bacterium]